MKKIIALLTLIALTVMTLGPVLGVAQEESVTTGLERGTGTGSPPIVKVKWEMKTGTLGLDDDLVTAGAQFTPPGIWGDTLNYTVCAIVTDPNGAADIYGVYADIYYPINVAYSEDPSNPDQHPSYLPEQGIGACGAFIEENTLLPLSKTDGYNLFCDSIRTNNENLPVFFSPYTYDEICAVDGELMKEEAYVYCDDKILKWEDPAGDYRVVVNALDKSGNSSAARENWFTYLPFTGFEKDFSFVDYGQVLLNTHKKISGDLTWDNGIASIRNLGNTRVWMNIAQDDMGLGQTSGEWNVEYDARVGNNEADWKIYDPFGFKPATPVSEDYSQLEDILELSEIEEMDFSILVTKWPDTSTSYSGTMWLNATEAPLRICE